LRKITQFPANRHVSAVRQDVSGEDFGEGRFSCAVSANETDLVTLVDTETDLGHEGSCPDTDLEV
jgi:hypothetical protein